MRIRATFARYFDSDPATGLPAPTPPAPPTPAPEPRSPGRVTCEGCGCSLDAKGLIIARGDGLRAFMAREDENARLQKELDGARAEITELNARIRELEPKQRRNILY
jgi:hypothetical protein